MTNALLSTSSVKLFGQVVLDLIIKPSEVDTDVNNVRLASTADIPDIAAPPVAIDTINLAVGDLVLLKDQKPANAANNGIYMYVEIVAGNFDFKPVPFDPARYVKVSEGGANAGNFYRYKPRNGKFKKEDNQLFNKKRERGGKNNFLEGQIDLDDASFAKIYGFSYEGRYFDLERPAIFLVHGEGEDLTDENPRAFSPPGPSDSGLGAAEFQFARDMKYWEYDKADFTVRMDMFAGMFEEVLLGFELDGGDDPMDGGGSVGGGRVGGGRVGGGRVGGGRVGGGRVGGGRVGGGRVGGGRVGGGRVGGG